MVGIGSYWLVINMADPHLKWESPPRHDPMTCSSLETYGSSWSIEAQKQKQKKGRIMSYPIVKGSSKEKYVVGGRYLKDLVLGGCLTTFSQGYGLAISSFV